MSNNISKKTHSILGKIFKSNTQRILDTIGAYEELYKLEDISHQEDVNKELFDYCRKRSFFVIAAVYCIREGIFLLRRVGDKLGWELPGSSIKSNINETVQDAVIRVIDREIPGIEIGELEPVAKITNEFKFQGQTVKHQGVAFMARSRNIDSKKIDNMDEVKGRFVDDPEDALFRFANQKIFEIVKGKIENQPREPPEAEILSGEKYRSRYHLHKKTISRIFSPLTSLRIERRVLQIVDEIQNKAFLDVSCGDCELVFTFARNKAKLCVANDVSWNMIKFLLDKSRQNQYNNIIFTNHNVTALPFNKIFDYVLCKNTLHHMKNENELLLLLENLRRVCKRKIIIIEIENPLRHPLKAKLWHYYYKRFLGDIGDSFFTDQDMKSVLIDFFKGDSIKFDNVNTIKGLYLLTTITVRS